MTEMAELSQGELLEQLLEQGGVQGAAFVSAEGEILESRTAAHDLAQDLTEVSAMLGSCLASNRLLTELVGEEVASQTMLAFTSGALLLTRAAPDTALTLVALTTEAEADRVRFSVRRLLPQLAGADADAEVT